MLSGFAGRCWPLIGLIALLYLSFSGLLRHGNVANLQTQAAEQLQPRIVAMLAQGESRGYQALLQQYQPAGSLRLEVRDREGRAIAVWPAPHTFSEWGILSKWMQEIAAFGQRLVAKQEIYVLYDQGRPVGELWLSRPRGGFLITRQSGLDLVALCLALMGLWSLIRMGITPFSDPVVVQAKASRSSGLSDENVAELGLPLEQLGYGLIRVNSEACVSHMNTAAQVLTGWPVEEALGLPLTSVVKAEAANPASPEPIASSLLGCYDEKGLSQPFSLRQRNENLVPVVITQLPLRSDGTADGLLLILADVSEQDAELDRLRKEAHLMAKTLDYMSDGLAITNRYGRITRCNKKLSDQFAYPEQSLEGMTVSKLMPVPFLNDADVSLKSYLPDRRLHSPAVVGWRQDASTFAVDLRVEELFDDEQAYLLLVRDRASRQQEENLAQRFAAVADSVPCAFLILDTESGYCNAANPQALKDFGYREDQLRRMSLSHLVENFDAQLFAQKVALLKSGSESVYDAAVQVRLADGSRSSAKLRLAWSGDEEPAVILAFISLA